MAFRHINGNVFIFACKKVVEGFEFTAFKGAHVDIVLFNESRNDSPGKRASQKDTQDFWHLEKKNYIVQKSSES